jgi:hypothetical protein
MGWGAAIIGVLSSLPELLSLFKNFLGWIQKVSGGDIAGFVSKTNQAFVLLNKAQTEAEMIEAAKAIQDAIKNTR